MTIRGQVPWSRAHVFDLVRDAVPPRWVVVSVLEDPFRGVITVTLDVPSWWRRLWLTKGERAGFLVAAVQVLADAPVGVMISVGWK